MNETTPARLPRGIEVFAPIFALKNDCSARLLTDRRLDEAWLWLRKLSAHREHFDKHIPNYFRSYGRMSDEQLSNLAFGDPLASLELPPKLKATLLSIDGGYSPLEYGLHISDLSVFDHLSAAMYCELVNEFAQDPPYGNYSTVKDWADKCFEAADLCEMYSKADPTIWHESDIQCALAIARDYLRKKGEERLMKGNPRIVKRSGRKNRGGEREDDKPRSTARAITTYVQRYFGPFPGSFPNTAVARFLMVGWGLDRDVTALAEKVPDWCKDLIKPLNPSPPQLSSPP